MAGKFAPGSLRLDDPALSGLAALQAKRDEENAELNRMAKGEAPEKTPESPRPLPVTADGGPAARPAKKEQKTPTAKKAEKKEKVEPATEETVPLPVYLPASLHRALKTKQYEESMKGHKMSISSYIVELVRRDLDKS